MKTDSIFYNIFQEFPSVFFALLGIPAESANQYQFTSQEVKQLAFRLDGLFLPIIPILNYHSTLSKSNFNQIQHSTIVCLPNYSSISNNTNRRTLGNW